MKNNQWQASAYTEHAAFVSSMATEVVSLLAPVAGESILDLGCGDGQLAEYISAQGCLVSCVDASPSMVSAAKARGLSAALANGNKLEFSNHFDAVFSNAALHWMLDPEAVLEGVYRALKAKGRFVAEMGGQGNISALLKAMTDVFSENKDFGTFNNPWFFPSESDYRRLLERTGFRVDSIERISRPTPLASGIEQWLAVFADSICADLNAQQKKRFFTQVKVRLVGTLYSENDGWVADYVRLRFKAVKDSTD
ncbi:SAM-dependent methyltransferase [Gammaproteobacteria bacterium 53_120_T64]|nr:SAM-dependent methyltransferase [Gammaproteobacteria bacterium 53_120_T64]